MRYRGGKIKREHALIKGLKELLESIEHWEEIKSIIPGRIKPVNKSHSICLKVQYQTENGLKCLCLSDSAVQEVFIVSRSPELLSLKLKSLK